MTPAELMVAYTRDQHRRGLSDRYVDDTGYAIRRFLAFVGDRPLDDLTRADVEAWIDAQAIAVGARRNYIGFLHQFFLFANELTGATPIPTAKIRRPRQRRGLPRPIRDEYLRSAVDSAPTAELRTWLLLAAYEGLRCQEIAGLDREDIDDEQGELRVRHGKGDKPRRVPLHPEVAAALLAPTLPAKGPLFRMPDGRRVPPYVVSQRLNRHLARLGIPSTAHALRHWYGTRMYKATLDLRLVQEMLGHASPMTTAQYAGFDESRAAAAVAALTIRGE